RIFMTLFGNSYAPFGFDPSTDQLEAVERYAKYIVDRYGAYVDYWELLNEADASDLWIDEVANYIRRVDPYGHRISVSWERNLSSIDIDAPHWYDSESEFDSDSLTASEAADWKSWGKPVIVGEQGNFYINWDSSSAARMAIRSWTAFFNEIALVFWDLEDFKDRVGGAEYIGPEERSYIRHLQDFTNGIPADARIAPI